MQECEVKMEADTLVLGITCEIDHHTAKRLRETIDPEILGRGAGRIVLDFSRVSFMDSSGIGLIIGRAAKAETVCASVEVRGLSPRLEKIVRMAGIERIPNVNIN